MVKVLVMGVRLVIVCKGPCCLVFFSFFGPEQAG